MENINYKLIGKRLKEAREKKKITQEKLAENLDVSIGYISQVERGLKHFNLQRIAHVSKIFEIPVSYIIDGSISDKPVDATSELLEAIKDYSEEEIRELIQKLS